MQVFNKINNIAGWSLFGISLIVYVLTVEPTASFWDCGEFIASSYRLQVPHPPGAPFFLLMGRMFSFLAGGDVAQVAYWINISSALYSAFTILFLFWTITLLALKLYPKNQALTQNQIVTIMGTGAIGALAYTFSDSFWFSAVEAEVYAMSSFFTAFVVWAILKWDRITDEKQANRWLILIAYMVGLSIGVHLLNLVTLPALALIYYYKKYPKTNLIGIGITLFIGLVLIVFIQNGIITGLPSFAGNFEIFFVNNLGLPFGSGIIFFSLLFLGFLVFGVYYSAKNNKVHLNTALLSLCFILIGYASYAMIVVRAQYDPPINENNPNDIIRFVYYLNREQYGDRPLLYGPTYASRLTDQTKGAAIYRKASEKGKYEIYDYKTENEYDKKIFLPRVWSRQGSHKQLYQQKLGLKTIVDAQGRSTLEEPTMGDNMRFMMQHQFGHMYFRYFGWNFVGRMSDYEGSGVLTPFDLGKEVPEKISENKARNNFFALPLILGLLGLVFQMLKNRDQFIFTFMLFFLTGLALVIYLNSPPVEPRERDYIYVGSFYAFAIWIGFGVMYIAEGLSRFAKGITGPAVAIGLGAMVPIIMAVEGWDDHNRSNRYHSIDSAKNLLSSCAPNAILFTGGDNDTFPLWYVQDVEGFRTDVRICNLSLLGTDWYIEQMKRAAYESAPLPISLSSANTIRGTNDQVVFLPDNPNIPENVRAQLQIFGIDLNVYLKYVRENDRSIKVDFRTVTLNTYPTKRMVLQLDKEKILKQGFIPKGMEKNLGDKMIWELNADDLFKNDLMVLDIIATNSANGWKRPIYFSSTLATSSYLNLEEYFQQEGLTYRLLPIKPFEVRVKEYAEDSKGDSTKVTFEVLGTKPPFSYQVLSADGNPVTNPLESKNGEIPLTLATGGYQIQMITDFGVKTTQFVAAGGRVDENGIQTEGDIFVNTELMFENMMNKFFYRELNNPDVYYSDTYRSFPLNLRSSFASLAEQLVAKGEKEKAKKVVFKALEVLPDEVHPYDVYTPALAGVLLQVGEKKKAMEIIKILGKRAEENLKYLSEQTNPGRRSIQTNLAILGQIVRVLDENGIEEATYYEQILQAQYSRF